MPARRGHRHHFAKLTPDIVREIRDVYALGKHSMLELASAAGVDQSTVHDVVHRKTWRDIE